MVYRIYVEKKAQFAHEADSLKNNIQKLLQIDGLTDVRVINRYDVENLDKELFDYAVKTVFSEPQVDSTYETLDYTNTDYAFAVEFLPGQFDQRANSAAECIQIITKGERPVVRTAKVYLLSGNLSEEDIAEIKKFVINPVESREVVLETHLRLNMKFQQKLLYLRVSFLLTRMVLRNS